MIWNVVSDGADDTIIATLRHPVIRYMGNLQYFLCDIGGGDGFSEGGRNGPERSYF